MFVKVRDVCEGKEMFLKVEMFVKVRDVCEGKRCF